MTSRQMNWAGNHEFAATIDYPETMEELQELVRGYEKVRAVGTRHSFNELADSAHHMICIEHFDRVLLLDKQRLTVTVEGGIRYGELSQHLQREGFALHNLASLPHISVAGACATATHGSGNRTGNLATAVSAMELITASGEVVQLSREKDGDVFDGMVVGLGGFGIVTKLTLDIQPTFEMQQDLYENLPLSALEDHLEEITSSGYSVSLFTDWKTETVNQIWVKRRLRDGKKQEVLSQLHGALPATRNLHPIAHISAENCTEQMGVPGAWHERLPHFRLDHMPSSGEELQTEYFVPRQDAVQALQAIRVLSDRISPLLQISEIRTIAADDLWMSPCYKQDSVALHFTWKKDQPAVMKLLPSIEQALEPFKPRPHWGKLFTISPRQLGERYEKLPQFKQLLSQHDPHGKFRNPFLDLYIFGRGE
jgi:xylitol oxidase